MQPHLASADDAFTAALARFSTTYGWLRADAMDLAHGDIEQHVLLASREIERRMLQAHFGLRARREFEAPRPPDVADDAEACVQACNLDTVVGRVRLTRRAWKRKGTPTIRPPDAAIDLPREVCSSGVRRFVREQLADRSVVRCGEACVSWASTFRDGNASCSLRMAQDFDAFYREHERPANDTPTTRRCWCSRPTPRAFEWCRALFARPPARRPPARPRTPSGVIRWPPDRSVLTTVAWLS